MQIFLIFINSKGGGVDYGSGPYTVIFPAGETSMSFDVPITDDVILENTEMFSVAIDPSLPDRVTVGSPGQATVAIQDSDCELLCILYLLDLCCRGTIIVWPKINFKCCRIVVLFDGTLLLSATLSDFIAL